MTADATLPGALGTFGWDDEGVPAQRIEVVKEGLFVGYLTDRENASRLSLPRSMGAARASGWNRIPLVRMTNVSLEPGTWTLERPGPTTATGTESGSGSGNPPGACSLVGSLAGKVSATALSWLPFVRALATPNVPSESRNAAAW